MALNWIRESSPRWDDNKARIIGGAPEGIFATAPADGDIAPGDWWRVEQDGQTVGYGWMDIVWGHGEILLAVAPEAQEHGVGTFVLDQLEQEAAARGLRYIFNTIPPSHPHHEAVRSWLQARGFAHISGDERLVRRVQAQRMRSAG